MGWTSMLQYRADLAIWLTAITITPLVSLAIWFTVAKAAELTQSPRDILTYYVVVALLSIATVSWTGSELIQEILRGTIIQFLVRPLSVFWRHITETIVVKSFQLGLPLLVVGGVAFIKPELLSLELLKLKHVIIFIPSFLLAITISFAMDMIIGTLAFWLEDAQELQSYRFLLMQVASGILVPFSVMPAQVRDLLSLLPFRYIISAPAEILLGQAEGNIVDVLAYQLVWAAALTALLTFLWKRGLKTYAVPGQ